MEFNKKCHNCATYRPSYTESICATCWRCSNWRPDATMQALIKKAIEKENQNLAEYERYVKEDIAMTKASYNHYFRNDDFVKNVTMIHFSKGVEIDIRDNIKDVIFNDPATIILWKDGSKTVVKAQEGELYDPEKGFAMAIAKKVLGGQGNYFEVFKKWVPEEDNVCELHFYLEDFAKMINAGIKDGIKAMKSLGIENTKETLEEKSEEDKTEE